MTFRKITFDNIVNSIEQSEQTRERERRERERERERERF